MKYVKTTLCAGVVLGALFMATPALAREFTLKGFLASRHAK